LLLLHLVLTEYGLFPEKVVDDPGGPFVAVQQVAQTLGSCRSVLGWHEVSAQFREEQPVGSVTKSNNGFECAEEGSDQASVNGSVEALEEWEDKFVELESECEGDGSVVLIALRSVEGKECVWCGIWVR
jgi:hypothetical protein